MDTAGVLDDEAIQSLILDGKSLSDRGNEQGAQVKFAKAICHLVKEYKVMVGAFCVNMMPEGEKPRGPEIARDAFAIVWEQMRRYRGEASVKTWMFAIIRKVCLNERRTIFREKRRQAAANERVRQEARERGSLRKATPHILQPDLSSTPEAQFTRQSDMRLREQAFEQLPPITRTLLRMVALHGVKAAAEAFGIKEVTVRKRLSRGREALDKIMVMLEERHGP